jgi:hypothetical protein
MAISQTGSLSPGRVHRQKLGTSQAYAEQEQAATELEQRLDGSCH